MAVAGAFYPADPQQLAQTVDTLLEDAAGTAEAPYAADRLRAVIVPHAGYVYSGPCAAAAYHRLRAVRGRITRVVMLGPSHRFAFRGIAQCSYQAYGSPLGTVPLDLAARAQLATLPEVITEDRAHAQDHALEVQLPFLQRVLGPVTLVPLMVGGASLTALVGVLNALLSDQTAAETLIVISSDLSHFLDPPAAAALDGRTCDGITHFDLTPLNDGNSACGRFPIAALLQWGIGQGWRAEFLDRRTSCDARASDGTALTERLVGYGAWAFYSPTADQAEAEVQALLDQHGPAMIAAAGQAIRYGFDHPTDPLSLAQARLAPETAQALRHPGACFVTLTKDHALRGCIGSPQAWRALGTDLLDNAHKAAFADRRFPPLDGQEWGEVSLSLSLLTPPAAFPVADRADALARLRPGLDGLILEDGAKRALFLPAVWDQLPDPETFVSHLMEKAGLPPKHWSATVRLKRFSSRSISAPLEP
jgi:AmmeMemoRadiSam system protein B/AmmeMemoRadiSam system protein A